MSKNKFHLYYLWFLQLNRTHLYDDMVDTRIHVLYYMKLRYQARNIFQSGFVQNTQFGTLRRLVHNIIHFTKQFTMNLKLELTRIYLTSLPQLNIALLFLYVLNCVFFRISQRFWKFQVILFLMKLYMGIVKLMTQKCIV